MRLDLGYIFGHLSEFILFVYFANTSFLPKKKYWISSTMVFIGYLVLFIVGQLGYPQISITLFFIINTVILTCYYHVEIKGAIFYSLILDTLSVIGEYAVIYMIGINYSSLQLELTAQQSLIVTIGGKLIYLIGIIVLKRFIKKTGKVKNDSLILLSIVPLITLITLTVIMTKEIDYRLFCMICIMLIIINIIVFAINEVINSKNSKIQMLQNEYDNNKANLYEYKLLSEKYENTKIMRHDFAKQLKALKELINVDNEQAKESIQKLEYSNRELSYAQYTNNTILNILFSQKIEESHKHGVELHINSTYPKFDFISEIDTVAIFSNLLDNAIEASEKSSEKLIFVDLYTVNEAYSVAKIENTADSEPLVLNGVLRTQKLNDNLHGLGIKSINNTLKKYGSELSWSYDKDNKLFRTITLLRIKEEKMTVAT